MACTPWRIGQAPPLEIADAGQGEWRQFPDGAGQGEGEIIRQPAGNIAYEAQGQVKLRRGLPTGASNAAHHSLKSGDHIRCGISA